MEILRFILSSLSISVARQENCKVHHILQLKRGAKRRKGAGKREGFVFCRLTQLPLTSLERHGKAIPGRKDPKGRRESTQDKHELAKITQLRSLSEDHSQDTTYV